MTIDLRRKFVRQPSLQSLLVAKVHFLVAFVDTKRAAKRFCFRVTLRFQFWQPAEEHVDLEHGAFIRRVRLIRFAEEFRQYVPAEVYEKEARLDCVRFSVQLKFSASLFPGHIQRVKMDSR